MLRRSGTAPVRVQSNGTGACALPRPRNGRGTPKERHRLADFILLHSSTAEGETNSMLKGRAMPAKQAFPPQRLSPALPTPQAHGRHLCSVRHTRVLDRVESSPWRSSALASSCVCPCPRRRCAARLTTLPRRGGFSTSGSSASSPPQASRMCILISTRQTHAG